MKRLRIYAGPNGAGKSSLHTQLSDQFNNGYFVNADAFMFKYQNDGLFDFNECELLVNEVEWVCFCRQHGLGKKAKLLNYSHVRDNFLIFDKGPGSYEMAVLSDFIRCKLLESGRTFSCETVFSHESKLKLMCDANDMGYRCYLYFTSLGNPRTSVERVQQRVSAGGHDVPELKIRERYERTMNNLLPAMRLAYRSYIFDNSGSEMNLVMEVTPANEVVFRMNRIPVWVNEYVLSRLK